MKLIHARFPSPRAAWLLVLLLGPVSWAQTASLQIQELAGGQVQIEWTDRPAGLVLESADRLTQPVPWQTASETPVAAGDLRTVTVTAAGSARFYRLRAAELTTILETSPGSGEAGVSLNRETIFRFSNPLAAGTQFATERLFAEFGGRKLLSRVELAQDRREATLFYLEPLPAGAAVRVSLVTDGLQDASGQGVDGDGDGVSGGTRAVTFTTMSTAGLPGTGVFGRVFASDPVPNGAGVTNRPLVGVIVTVDGAEERMRAQTDENGYFRLSPSPAGRFFVHIDGRPAQGSDWPTGDYYPFVGKTFEAVAGSTNNQAGGTGEIFLPLVKAGTLQPISATQPTTIGFPPGVLAEHPELAGVSITVPPNALYADDGSRGGRVGLAPVAPDRIPSPLPPGLEFPLVITIQTDGPQNFAEPVPVRFPNLPDPVTGQVLPPGAKSALWSYNHDTGRWEIQGSMTVSADGKFLDTDPGVGVRQPGWHGGSPGSPGNGPGGGGGGCDTEQAAVERALFGCAFGIGLGLLEVAPAIGCGISLAQAVNGAMGGCSDPNGSCAGSIAYNAFFGAAGCIPGPVGGTIGTFAALLQCGIELGDATADLAICQETIGNQTAQARRGIALQSPGLAGPDVRALQNEVNRSAGALVTSILGDSVWLVVAHEDPERMVPFATELVEALDPSGDAGARISAAEQAALLALPAPAGVSLAARTALLNRFDRFAQGGMTAAESVAIQQSSTALNASIQTASDLGWTTMFDGISQTLAAISTGFDAEATRGSAGGITLQRRDPSLKILPPSPRVQSRFARELLYRLVDQTDGTVRYGRTDASGILSSVIMAADRDFVLTYLDPLTLAVGSVYFRSGSPGTPFRIPYARMAPVAGPDSDGDGLNDLAESIAGTSPELPDTDNDGTTDLVEVQQGQNPLDGIALSQGVVASVVLGGSAGNARALGLHLEGALLFVANGRRGLAVLDLGDPLQPTWLSELALPGSSTDVAYAPEARTVGLIGDPEAFVPGERGELHFVDASDPIQPRRMLSYSLPAVAIDRWNGRFFVALGKFAAKEVRLYDAGSGLEIGNFATQDYATGLRVVGGRAYVATQSGLEIYDVTASPSVRLGRLAGDFTAELLGQTHLVLDGTTLFVGKTKGAATVDVSNPAAPAFIGQAAATAGAVRSLALSGGGRLAALTLGTPAGNTQAAALLSIFNVADPANLSAFELGLNPQWRGRDLVMHGGYAVVADDSAGISVMNFAGPDLARQAPAITFNPASLDRDPATPGIQVIRGQPLELAPRIQDDVHLSRVEFLLDGQVQETVRTYPIDLGLFKSGVDALLTNLVVQFRAFDRSGNESVSPPVVLETIPDLVPPVLSGSLPGPGGAAFAGQVIVLEFNEPVDTLPLDATKVRLLYLGADTLPGGGDDTLVPLTAWLARGATLNLDFPGARIGRYQLTLDPGVVADRAGNAFAQTLTITFDLLQADPGAAVWISDADGPWSNPANWLHGRLPAQDDDTVIQRFGAKPKVTLDSSAIVRSLTLATPFTTANRASLSVLHDLRATESVDWPVGSLIVDGSAVFEGPLTAGGGTLDASGRLETKGRLSLSQGARLTLSGPAAQFIPLGGLEGANFRITARDGAVIDLPGLVNYDGPGDFTPLFPVGTAFIAQGSGSRLALSEMVTGTGPETWNARGAPALTFEAAAGGRVDLPALTSLSNRVTLSAHDAGSVLSAPLLASVIGTDAPFEARIEAAANGRVEVPKLTVIEHCPITETDGGVVVRPGL